MSPTPNEAKLRTAFCEALGVSRDTDFDQLAYRSIPQWDSVAHMQLVAVIETSFDIMLDTDDVIALSSFPKAREIVGRHGVEI